MEMRSGVSFVHLGTKKIDVFLLGVEDVAESDEFGTEGRRRKRKLATSEAQTPQGERESKKEGSRVELDSVLWRQERAEERAGSARSSDARELEREKHEDSRSSAHQCP